MADLSFEQKYWHQGLEVVGADEVGRGCLAGPVVAAAVILPSKLRENPEFYKNSDWSLLDDSKKLTPALRLRLSKFIQEQTKASVRWCLADEVDRYNILHASMFAMRKALAEFVRQAQVVLVDGHQSPYACMFVDRFRGDSFSQNKFQKVETIIKGDSKSLAIAAASVVAKVYRDQWMVELEKEFSGYGLAKHKGYPTADHYQALAMLGPSQIHRKSFSLTK